MSYTKIRGIAVLQSIEQGAAILTAQSGEYSTDVLIDLPQNSVVADAMSGVGKGGAVYVEGRFHLAVAPDPQDETRKIGMVGCHQAYAVPMPADSPNFLKMTLNGNVGRDAADSVRYGDDGVMFGYISVALNDRQNRDITYWFDVSHRGSLSEFANRWIHKGASVIVDGFPRVEPRSDGKPGWNLKLRAISIDFARGVGRRQDGEPGGDAERKPDTAGDWPSF